MRGPRRGFDRARGLLLLLLLLCLVLAAASLGLATASLGLAAGRRGLPARGGAARPRRDPAASPHLVVDTLNLVHWLRAQAPAPSGAAPAPAPAPVLGLREILSAVDSTAAPLKAAHPGRVMYVLKDRETCPVDALTRAALKAAAARNGVYIILTEKYPDQEAPRGVAPSKAHSARGRDDFYLALLAERWGCAVATEDRLKDFEQFRKTLQPFLVSEWAYWREGVHRDSVRPESRAYSRLRRPRAVRFRELLGA